MSRRNIVAALLMAVTLIATSCGSNSTTGSATTVGNITIKDAWVRAALVTSDDVQSAGYMVIENKGGAVDTLLSVSSDSAGAIEIHESKEMEGMKGMMSMSPLPNGLDIPANGSVEVKPGGFHLMIMKAKKEMYTPGRTVKLSFKFKSGAALTLDVPVREN